MPAPAQPPLPLAPPRHDIALPPQTVSEITRLLAALLIQLLEPDKEVDNDQAP